VLTDAELILGLSRHLGVYAVSSAKAGLGQLEFAGQVFELAWRLRESGVSSAGRVSAIGLEAGIAQRTLHRDVLPALESLGWVDLRRDEDGTILVVDERIPPPAELLGLAGSVLDIALPTASERAALVLLRETTMRPLLLEAALEAATSVASEENVRRALADLVSVRLIRRVRSEDGREVAFNPNVWVGEAEVVAAALRVEDARVRAEVGALMEEVASRPGLPESHVQSTKKKWIDFAVAQGLIQRSLVVTTEGRQQAFLFSPHLGRDPFGVTRGDPSGHVRQLVGSMMYAVVFAKWNLYSPAAFLRRLINEGEAGDASPIGTDYPMLETAGIVRIEPAARHFKFVLLQSDVAEEAVAYLEDPGSTTSPVSSPLRRQRAYIHVERERATLAAHVPTDEEHMSRLISALRDTTAKRSYGDR